MLHELGYTVLSEFELETILSHVALVPAPPPRNRKLLRFKRGFTLQDLGAWWYGDAKAQRAVATASGGTPACCFDANSRKVQGLQFSSTTIATASSTH